MILAMMVVYVFALHLIFNVFKWVNPTTRNKIYVTVVGLFFIYCILLVINVFQPMSTDLRVFRYAVPVSPLVSGQVAEVPIEANVPLEEGAVLFEIDPTPYQAQVDLLEAQLELARLRLKQSRALAKQKAGSVYEVEAFRAQVKQLEASLRAARFNLEHTSVRAPTSGHVSDIALRPGQVLGPGVPVMTFVSDSYVVGATFRQEVINRIKPGDEAEVALDTYRMNHSRYPSTEEGLEALLQPPGRDRGYIEVIPRDSWDNEFQYRSPGQNGDYDLWSYGRDGQEGGEGLDTDIGNWQPE